MEIPNIVAENQKEEKRIIKDEEDNMIAANKKKRGPSVVVKEEEDGFETRRWSSRSKARPNTDDGPSCPKKDTPSTNDVKQPSTSKAVRDGASTRPRYAAKHQVPDENGYLIYVESVKEKVNFEPSADQKIQYSIYIMHVVFPFLKRLNEEHIKEKEIEAKIQGGPSGLYVKKMALFAVEEVVKDLENPNRTTQKDKPAENKSGNVSTGIIMNVKQNIWIQLLVWDGSKTTNILLSNSAVSEA
nr:JmjC domain-containing protein [Tanacetum cinerariifolium]